jgi:small subunit ribosomal protein S5
MKKGRAPIREVKEFEEEVIQIDRVTRVVKGGRRLRFRATLVIGNKKGKVGVGIGKSTEVTGAISKAIAEAKKNLITVPMAGQTIPHRVQVKFKSAKVMLMPAIPGTGIKAGGSVRKVIELAGIKDIMGKCFGAPNRLNNSQAAIEALKKLKAIPWLKLKTDAKAGQDEAVAVKRQDEQHKPAGDHRNFGGRKPFAPRTGNKPAAKPENRQPAAEKTEKKAE